MTFMVYWTERVEGKFNSYTEARAQRFETGQLTEVMNFMEGLRKRERTDGSVSFVALASAIPGDVTKKGVDVTGPDYDWKKRRP